MTDERQAELDAQDRPPADPPDPDPEAGWAPPATGWRRLWLTVDRFANGEEGGLVWVYEDRPRRFESGGQSHYYSCRTRPHVTTLLPYHVRQFFGATPTPDHPLCVEVRVVADEKGKP